jgi:hypothetical protein
MGHALSLIRVPDPNDPNGGTMLDDGGRDNTDFMSPWASLFKRHTNAPHKVQMQWIDASREAVISNSGTYQIARLEDETDFVTPQVLKFPKEDQNSTYYVSYRRTEKYANEVHIHHHKGVAAYTYFDQSLSDGETFSDDVNGIQVTAVGHDDVYATVEINKSGPPCIQAAPAVTLSPTSRIGAPGSAQSYFVSVKNESSNCGAGTFNLTSQLPQGWSASFTQNPIDVNEGVSHGQNMTVTSDQNATEGSYAISFVAANAANPSMSASADATYIVFTDTTPPTVSIMEPANGATLSGNSTKVVVSHSDNIGVDKVQIKIDGAIASTISNPPNPVEYSWNTRKASSGNHLIAATAYDAEGNSTTDSVTVSKPTKGGGGGKPAK